MFVDPMRFRLVTVIQAMKIHLRTKGKMRLTRVATPSRLLAIASEYTGKKYKLGTKGMTQALADLEEVKLAPVTA
jgi:hypothetical protein